MRFFTRASLQTFALAALVHSFQAELRAQEKIEKIPIIVDTDFGSAVDDAFAMALVLASPELDLRGVTTVTGDTNIRALMICRMLSAARRREVPVARGSTPQAAAEIGSQYQYYYHPALIYNRMGKPVKESAVEFLYSQLKAQPGQITILAIGPLSNIARLLNEHPDCKPWIKRIVLMGGAIRVGYDGKPGATAEYNIATDIKAAQTVFSSGIPLVVAPLDATIALKLAEHMRLFEAGTLLTMQVEALYQLANEPEPTLFDPMAVTLCFNETFCRMEDLRLEVDDQGLTRIVSGTPNARVAAAVRARDALNWYVDRVRSVGQRALPRETRNATKAIAAGNLPARVHAFEDYETEIEKRWWMSGRLETNNVPPGNGRAFRSALTQDFDDLMGDLTTMYSAVIFNPVPGPPMGKQPRLSFRYWLKGTDTLRVQIYSLSNGYHRYLTLTNLPQGQWQAAAVDMTAVRRPDGSGGSLSENERIDDVQCYVDPRAELLIDEIVLYDAAPPAETRPFPRRIIFTGWFDTGAQGKEWPGEFQIVPHAAPRTWKAAKSVINKSTGDPWIRVHLRGQRPVTGPLNAQFRYRLSSGGVLKVGLVNSKTGAITSTTVAKPVLGEWTDSEAQFSNMRGDAAEIDEIHFTGEKNAEILLDDLLIYEPGK
ncbi:MAG: hypothetical protein FJ403_00050 [Verrucomicrobia bacterium]|nr:hypothetical protein [Verrucomicrobiota bacterium]